LVSLSFTSLINFISDIVGYGATSVVFKASYYNDEDLDQYGKPRKETVAIKKVKNIFESDVYTHRVLRELRLLRILQGHNNVSIFRSHLDLIYTFLF
jgi:serine/threonine protein kinase